MAKWQGYFKIVQPSTDLVTVSDNQSTDGTTYGNYSWYQKLVQGSASRISRYQEYDAMDGDVEVARALDIIAEKMTSNDSKTDLPIKIDVDEEEDERVTPAVVATLKTAARYWCKQHDWDNRLFHLARNACKYGDYFFKRPKRLGDKWLPVHPKAILGAVVDEHDITKIYGYHVKIETRRANGNNQGMPLGSQYDTEFVDASEIVRFTLNNDMSQIAPFGESILAAVYRAHKQKEMLEDAIIIYRVVRAPERRVFYIDVGKMPAQRTKQYLESMKNEIRQRKIPSAAGGKENIDSVYNPQSMQEDYFFAQRADGKGSRVETLPGGQGLGELADLEYFQDKVFRGLRVPVSWMDEMKGGNGAIVNEGKVGQSYIQEIQFMKFVERLQGSIERVLDIEFKRFLRDNNIMIDESLYTIKLVEGSDYIKYRQAELDQMLINSYQGVSEIPFLSKRYGLTKFFQLEEDELLTNEKMRMEELGIDINDPDRLQKLYNENYEDALGSMGGGGGGGGGGMAPPMPGGPNTDLGPDAGDADTTTTDMAQDQNAPTDQSTPAATKAPGKGAAGNTQKPATSNGIAGKAGPGA